MVANLPHATNQKERVGHYGNRVASWLETMAASGGPHPQFAACPPLWPSWPCGVKVSQAGRWGSHKATVEDTARPCPARQRPISGLIFRGRVIVTTPAAAAYRSRWPMQSRKITIRQSYMSAIRADQLIYTQQHPFLVTCNKCLQSEIALQHLVIMFHIWLSVPSGHDDQCYIIHQIYPQQKCKTVTNTFIVILLQSDKWHKLIKTN